MRFLAISFLLTGLSFAEHNHLQNIPAGIMRSHTHEEGYGMVMYNTSHNVLNGVALNANYDESTKGMAMGMDMFGGMYGFTDYFTLSGMISYMNMKMDTQSATVGDRSHTVSGFGDTQIDGMFRVLSTDDHHLQLNIGAILPTGNVDAMHTMYANHGSGMHTHKMKNAYNMQLGTGSLSLTPGISYTMNYEDVWQFGAQGNAVMRLHNNNNGYRFGDIYNITSWIGNDINDMVSVSGRLDYTSIGAIHGQDLQISQSMSALNVPGFTYREQLTLLAGVNVNLYGAFHGTKIQAEIGTPLYQRIASGIPSNIFVINAGLQYTF